MGYYMGDASAARHQGGLFSFIGKALSKVARVAVGMLPGPVGIIGRVLTHQSPAPTLGTLMGRFIPGAVPGAPPSAATGTHPVSSPHPVKRKSAPGRSPKRFNAGQRRRAGANAATRARLRARGYRV